MIRSGLMIGLALTSLACSPGRSVRRFIGQHPVLRGHYVGVSVYDPARERYVVQQNADRLFTPASNTKLFSFYAGLTQLGDSLPALRYVSRGDTLFFWGTGYPLLLHPDLPDTNVVAWLRSRPEKTLGYVADNYAGGRFGSGWAWNDFADDYSPEIAPLPLYGNVVRFSGRGGRYVVTPRRFADSLTTGLASPSVDRSETANRFFGPTAAPSRPQNVPFRWSGGLVAALLRDTLRRNVVVVRGPVATAAPTTLYGRVPADSLHKRTQHVSDNMLAEHLLLMASAPDRNRVNPIPNTTTSVAATLLQRRAIDSTLARLRLPGPQPRWVDGSGLSRYNLFTPNQLITLLRALYALVPQPRLFALLPAGGQSGTLRGLPAAGGQPFIWAKSGSMGGVYNLSGYVRTRRGKLLLVSVMNNQFTQPVADVRRATGELLLRLHQTYR